MSVCFHATTYFIMCIGIKMIILFVKFYSASYNVENCDRQMASKVLFCGLYQNSVQINDVSLLFEKPCLVTS